MTPFITSKYGKIEGLKLYKYKFSEALIRQPKMFEAFHKWIRYNDDITIVTIDDKQFQTLSPLKEDSNWQYVLFDVSNIDSPIQNTQLVSRHLSSLVHRAFEPHFKRFLMNNEYVFKKIDLSPFKLSRCIGFSLEVFEQATFLINFCPQTRITSNSILTEEYLDELIRGLSKNGDASFFTVVELSRLRRISIDILSDKAVSRLKEHIREGKKFVATFDYSFVSNYSKDLFFKLTTMTRKDVDENILNIQEVLETIKFDPILNVQSKPFYKVKIESLGQERNLLVGSDKAVNKQSAAHYNGVFRPAKNAIIQPILFDVPYPNLFEALFIEFNGAEIDVIIKEPISLNPNESNLVRLNAIKNDCNAINYLCPVFAAGILPTDVLDQFRKNKIHYQLYSGSLERAKLANFTVRCIEKLGGLLSVIKDNSVDERTYFIGIDLGHSKETKTSRVAFSYFNYRGELVHYNVTEDLDLNEALTSEIWQNLDAFRSLYKSGKIPAPERIIVHRDGRLHTGDIEVLVDHFQRHFDVYEIEIVEIIKSGFPVIAGFDTGAYVNLESGDAYIDNENKYAILITNTQSSLTNSLVKPIIIKHKYGDEEMKTLVRQIYWFSKVYTNNLYRSTRLPATTLKANNIVGTGNKEYTPSYLS